MCTDIQMLLFYFCLLADIGLSQQVNHDLKLKIHPRNLQVNVDKTPAINVLCTLQDADDKDVPLAGCEFSSYYDDSHWQFSEGHASPNKSFSGLMGRYHGRGLNHGECGMTLGGYVKDNKFILGCRVRAATGGGWRHAVMTIDGSNRLGYYIFYPEKKTWPEADKFCRSKSSHLVIINSKREEDAVVKLRKTYGVQNSWIGANDIEEEGTFVTVLGGRLTDAVYVNWSKGEPNNGNVKLGTGQDCIQMYGDGTLDDLSCTDQLSFMCEFH